MTVLVVLFQLLVIFGPLIAIAVIFQFGRNLSGTRKALAASAELLALDDGLRSPLRNKAEGVVDGMSVRFEYVGPGQARILVRNLERHFTIRRRKAWRSDPGFRVETGDSKLHEVFEAFGPEGLVLSRLGEEVRRLLLNLPPGDVELLDGELVYRPIYVSFQAERLAVTTRHLAAIALGFEDDDRSIPQHLAINASSDRMLPVRERNLLVLLRDHASSEHARVAIEAALHSGHPSLTYLGTRALGRTDSALAKAAAFDQAAGVEVRRLAIKELFSELDAEELLRVLERLLDDKDPEVRRISLEALRNVGPDAEPLLGRVLVGARNLGDEDRGLLVRMLVETGGERAEPILMEHLHRSTGHGVDVLLAIQGLGTVGTPRSLAVLQPLIDSGDYVVKRMARFAANAIRVRMGEHGDGRLSISGFEVSGGELSTAALGSGALSDVTAAEDLPDEDEPASATRR